MAVFLNDAVLDGAIAVLTTNVTTLYICSQLPATYAEASSTYKLGTKTSPSLGSVGNGTPSGRKTTIAAITDGAVNPGGGTATHWALTSGSVLYAAGTLTPTQAVTNGNTFSLTAFDITMPDPA
jgi:hypothetical protein